MAEEGLSMTSCRSLGRGELGMPLLVVLYSYLFVFCGVCRMPPPRICIGMTKPLNITQALREPVL